MNEQAIKDAYELFVSTGYKKSIEDFKQLIASNPEALKDAYGLFVENGYKKSQDDFKTLMGIGIPTQEPIKKKEPTESSLETGSLGLQKPLNVAETTAIKKPITELPAKKEEEGQSWLMNTVSSLDRGFYKNLIGNPIKGLGTLLEKGTAKIIGGSGKGFVSDALINFGDYFNKTIDELAPQDEQFKNSLTDQFGQAFGQVVSMVLTAGAGAAGKGAALAAVPKTGSAVTTAAKQLASEVASPTSVSAGLSMGQSEFDRAKAAGATDDQAFEAFYKNAVVGSILEKVPVMQFLKRFNTASGGGLANYIKTKTVSGLTGGVEEMTTEVLQQLYANKSAQDIYNTNQDLFEGVGESGGVGFGVGFLLNAMGANAKLLRKEGKNEEADVVESQMQQFETQAQNGGPSSYKLNGIKVEAPVIEEMVDKLSASDLAKANIEIVNDPKLKIKMQDKIVTSSIKEQVREANPELNEKSLDAITELEKELQKLEGNKTQTGKDKAAALRQQIKDIQEKPLQEEAAADVAAAEASPTKTEANAVQEQTTNEVSVQPTSGDSGKMAEGTSESKPEVVATEGIKETITPESTEEEVTTENAVTKETSTLEKMIEEVKGKDETLESIYKKKLELLQKEPQRYVNQMLENAKSFVNEDGSYTYPEQVSYYEKLSSKFDESLIPQQEQSQEEVSSKTQEPEVQPVENVDDLMTADTTQPSVFQKVYDVLDGVDMSIDKQGKTTAGMNLALPVAKAIIKTLKALVKAGMTLEQAIRKAAADNKVEEQAVKDLLMSYQQQLIQQGESEAATELELPGFNRMMTELDGVVNKTIERGADALTAMDNAIAYLQGSRVYEDASDVQREAMVREIRKRFGKREKTAPSANKIVTEEADRKVTVDEYKALKDQIRLEARAARDAKNDINAKRKMLAAMINELVTKGKISVKKANTIIKKLSGVNLYSNTAIEKFVDYVGKVFADAEYGQKLSNANALRKAIKNLSKNKNKFANLRALGAAFADIDPSMVEDIDEYNRMANMVKESIKGSTIRKADVNFAAIAKESDVMEYVKEAMAAQEEKLYQMKLDEVKESLGVDGNGLTYEQLVELLASDKELSKDDEKLVRSAINKAFDIYASIVEEMLRTGKDPFTDEDIEFTKVQKEYIREFMDMDLNVLSPKQALEAVDALLNFMQNQSVAKMGAVVAKYNGDVNAQKADLMGIRAKPIRKYGSKWLGKLLLEQTANLNIVFERMFGGFTKGGKIEEMSGVTALKNGSAKAQTESNNIVERYVKQFYKLMPNKQAFNTAFNNIERGMVSFMMRNVIGSEEEMKAEFNRRKNLIGESIDVLKKGNEQEQERAKLYQEVYDNVLANAETIDDVVNKADATNVEAVQFWQEEWANKYDELADVALGVYNKVLGRDINYNPDKFTRLSTSESRTDLDNDEMAFIANSGNGPIYKKETGVLMAPTRPESLPKDSKKGKPNMYVDLSFDSNNSNAMYDALMDINTAAPIRQVDAFLNSPFIDDIIPDSDERAILARRVNLFVQNIRNKNPFSVDELSKAVKRLNRVASIGVGQALGGAFQPFKQAIPVAVNTLINAGGLDVRSMLDKSKQAFMNRSGFSIANRGVESQAQIESVNKLISEAAKSSPEKAFKLIEKANEWWLKYFLVNSDVMIARASWMTYYEQSLKKQGIDPNSIDYNTHEVNEEAADYAQRMVDRQQNVSDSNLAGSLLSSKDSTKQLFVKILMPFASFRMNQSARLGADISTLMSSTATTEDKKIAARSLMGFSAEMLTFRLISIGTATLISSAIKIALGREDDEEKDQKKKDAILKGQLTSTVSDVLSPFPLADKAINMGTAAILESTQDALDVEDKNRISVYSGAKQDFFQSLGLLGIAGSRANQLYELSSLASGSGYKDDYGREKYLSEPDRDRLKMMIVPAVLSNLGLAPSEVNSIIRGALADAKRNSSTQEGGKSAEDIQEDKERKSESADRKEETIQNREQKIKALNILKDEEMDDAKKKVINDMIEEYSMTDEERKSTRDERSDKEREKRKDIDKLLGDYDNRSEMKRYDPDLYEERFGEGSAFYEKYKDEMEVEKEMNKKIREMEDEEMGYTPKKRRRYTPKVLKKYSRRRSGYESMSN